MRCQTTLNVFVPVKLLSDISNKNRQTIESKANYIKEITHELKADFIELSLLPYTYPLNRLC